MSLLVVGLSHRSAPVELLERAALSGERGARLDAVLRGGDHVEEWMIVSTCNRVEIYGEVGTFHGAVTQISESLCAVTGLSLEELGDSLYAHYEERAIAHLFSVAAGLDSLAIGESQILGQLRSSLQDGREHGHLGSALENVAQQALRVGKKVHAETEIDRVSKGLIERGVALAEHRIGPIQRARATVIGSGAMSALATHTLSRMGVENITIVSRTLENARRLAAATGATAREWDERADAIAESDFVVSCTGAVGHVVEIEHVTGGDRPKVFLDLALPRDVDPAVAVLDAVTVLWLEDLREVTESEGSRSQVHAVEEMVTAEVAEFVLNRRAASVGPTVAAIRRYAADVVATELERLDSRVELDDRQRAQVQLSVHRIVEKLLHTPTVRMKQLAGSEDGSEYTSLLRTLFDIDPFVSKVSSIPRQVGGDS
ncbi:glutamyl-tRNA reductase [Yimella radicis]